MNLKGILAVAAVIIIIVLGLKLANGKYSHRNELSRSLDDAADNIEEVLNDAKRNIEDAVD